MKSLSENGIYQRKLLSQINLSWCSRTEEDRLSRKEEVGILMIIFKIRTYILDYWIYFFY